MLVYLDLNCFNRPFDDQTQRRVADETQATFRILERIVDGGLDLAWSEVLELENSRHPLVDRRAEIGRWQQKAAVHVAVDDAVTALAETLDEAGLSPLDAAHVACAEVAGCDALLTYDDRLIQRSERVALKLAVVNPIDFVQELDHG